jgi:gamma-F420-2:alpha-L-glutamate ligase
MKGWIIYRHDATQLWPEAYEVNRLLAEAQLDDLELEVFRPEQFDLIVTREDERSILINGEKRELPDFVLPRMGAGTTYFTLAILRQMERLGIYTVNSSTQSELSLRQELHLWQNRLIAS